MKRHHGRFTVVSPRDGVNYFIVVFFVTLFFFVCLQKKERKQSGTVESDFVVCSQI